MNHEHARSQRRAGRKAFGVCSILAAAAVLMVGVATSKPALTQTAPGHVVFETVDAVTEGPFDQSMRSPRISLQVTGIVWGQATTATVTTIWSGNQDMHHDQHNNCLRMALLAMDRPGRYRFQLRQGWTHHHDPSGPCRLVRN